MFLFTFYNIMDANQHLIQYTCKKGSIFTNMAPHCIRVWGTNRLCCLPRQKGDFSHTHSLHFFSLRPLTDPSHPNSEPDFETHSLRTLSSHLTHTHTLEFCCLTSPSSHLYILSETSCSFSRHRGSNTRLSVV